MRLVCDYLTKVGLGVAIFENWHTRSERQRFGVRSAQMHGASLHRSCRFRGVWNLLQPHPAAPPAKPNITPDQGRLPWPGVFVHQAHEGRLG